MKVLLNTAYWILSILVVALMVKSTGFSFLESLMLGTMYLPGAVAAKLLYPQVSFKRRSQGIMNVVFITLAIVVFEYLIIFMTYIFISNMREGLNVFQSYTYYFFDYRHYSKLVVPHILVNPLFLSVIIVLLTLGNTYLDHWMANHYPKIETPITFCSDRKKVTLLPSEIMYVESCDTEVYVHATDERIFRNKTNISGWEALLGADFVRIHRSFLVNSKKVDRATTDTITIKGKDLPVSLKYRESVTDKFIS